MKKFGTVINVCPVKNINNDVIRATFRMKGLKDTFLAIGSHAEKLCQRASDKLVVEATGSVYLLSNEQAFLVDDLSWK